MAPKPYQPPQKRKKKITFFCELEFRAFNLSVTCSTIRTVCLPSYLSHVRVSRKGVQSSDLQDVVRVILSDFYQLLSKPKTPLYFSQFNFHSYLTVSWKFYSLYFFWFYLQCLLLIGFYVQKQQIAMDSFLRTTNKQTHQLGPGCRRPRQAPCREVPETGSYAPR